MASAIVIQLTLLSLVIVLCSACNDYVIKKFELKSKECPIMNIDQNFGLEMDSQCNLISKGCIDYKSITTMMAKYHLQKKPMLNKSGELDVCKLLEDNSESPIIAPVIKLLGVTKCPIPEGKICGMTYSAKNKASRSDMMLAKGTSSAEFDLTTDQGKCNFKITMTIDKRS